MDNSLIEQFEELTDSVFLGQDNDQFYFVRHLVYYTYTSSEIANIIMFESQRIKA